MTFNIVTELSSQPKLQSSHRCKRYILWISNYKMMELTRWDKISVGCKHGKSLWVFRGVFFITANKQNKHCLHAQGFDSNTGNLWVQRIPLKIQLGPIADHVSLMVCFSH